VVVLSRTERVIGSSLFPIFLTRPRRRELLFLPVLLFGVKRLNATHWFRGTEKTAEERGIL